MSPTPNPTRPRLLAAFPKPTSRGLPLYQAHGGWASVGATFLLGYSLRGDLRKKGLSLFAVGSYSRLLDDARFNPYTAIRGTPNQWVGGGGVAIMF